MKLEEKIISGILHYRWYVSEDFKAYTQEQLTSIIQMLKDGKL